MTNKELIDLLKCYPQDAEVQILNAGSWDDGERWGHVPENVLAQNFTVINGVYNYPDRNGIIVKCKCCKVHIK